MTNYNVPPEWEAVYSKSTHAGDFEGDAPIEVGLLIGWLTPADKNGNRQFVSPDKLPSEYRTKEQGPLQFYLYVHCEKESAHYSLQDQLSQEDAWKYRTAALEHHILYEVRDGDAVAIALDGRPISDN